jgi:hypothetical protein
MHLGEFRATDKEVKTRAALWCAGLTAVILLVSTAGSILRAAGAAADSSFSADKGRFRILQQNVEAGTEDFSVEPAGNGWLIQGETIIHVSGSAAMRTWGQLHVAADGSPQRYSWSAEGEKKASGSVDFENGTAKTSATLAGAKQPLLRDFKFTSPRVAVLDNNLYEQYTVLGRLYDWNTKGKQTFPVLIPQDATPGSIDVESIGGTNADGASLQALRVHSTDLDIQIYFDEKLHLVRLEVPSAKVVIERQ